MDRLIQVETHISISQIVPRLCEYECRFLGPLESSSEGEYFCILFSESRKNRLILGSEVGHALRCKPCLEKDNV
jgi:hypothetical protein